MDQNCYHGKCSPKVMSCGGKVKKMAEGGPVSNAMESVGRALGTEKGKAMNAADKFLAAGRDEESMRSEVANKQARDRTRAARDEK